MRAIRPLVFLLLCISLGFQLGCERKMKVSVRTIIVDSGPTSSKDAGPSERQ